MKTMNLGHERNPIAIGQTIKNLFLVFSGGVSLAMLLIATQPLSHFPRYKIVTDLSMPASPVNNQSSNNNNNNSNKRLMAAVALATAAKPPGEMPPKEEKAVSKARANMKPAVFHIVTAPSKEARAMTTFLKENELRNDSIIKELAQVIDMHECHFGRASSEPLNDDLTNQFDSSVDQCIRLPATWNKIIVLGFTDNRGSRMKNIQLGMERAEKLKAILVARGIPAARITTASFGASLPIDSNNTETGRARNRRAEFNVLGDAASAGL